MFKKPPPENLAENLREVKVQPSSIKMRQRSEVLAFQRGGQFFLHRNLEIAWMDKLLTCSRPAIIVGLCIQYWSVLKKTDKIKVTSSTLKEKGISRHQKARALCELESKGLISVERQPGKNPVVAILSC